MTSEPASATTSHPPRKGRKYFTLAQANSALRYVSRVVADIMARYHAWSARTSRTMPSSFAASTSSRWTT
jgi:hypothetical protein